MIKVIKYVCLFMFCFCLTSCSCNKDELINYNEILFEENNKLENDILIYEGVGKLFEFYNNITTENVNSFVLVESKRKLGSSALYSDGVVVASSGNDFYVLTDYNKIAQTGMVDYRIMDSKASVYEAHLPTSNGKVIYDEFSGLVLLKVSNVSNSKMETIEMGEINELSAHISSVDHINKVQLSEKIKTSTIEYNDTSYSSYSFTDLEVNNGGIINSNNKLCGIYLSNINGFINSDLIKEIVYSTYSLIL